MGDPNRKSKYNYDEDIAKFHKAMDVDNDFINPDDIEIELVEPRDAEVESPRVVTQESVSVKTSRSKRRDYKFKIVEQGMMEECRAEIVETKRLLVDPGLFESRLTDAEANERIQKAKDKYAVEAFLFAGTDFKGQAQYATAAKGTRGSLSVCFNPFALFGDIVSLAVSASAEVQSAATIGLVVLRGPKETDIGAKRHDILRPITLHSFSGHSWKVKVGADAEARLGFKFKASSKEGDDWTSDAEFKDTDELKKKKEKEQKASRAAEEAEKKKQTKIAEVERESAAEANKAQKAYIDARSKAKTEAEKKRAVRALEREKERIEKEKEQKKKKIEEAESEEQEEEEEEEEEEGEKPEEGESDDKEAAADDRDTTLEDFAVRAEASITASVGAQYTYETLYMVDPTPAHYGVGARSLLAEDLAELLHEGSTKAIVKMRACDLVRRANEKAKSKKKDAPDLFTPVKLERTFGITIRISSEKILESLLFPLNVAAVTIPVSIRKEEYKPEFHAGVIPDEYKTEVHRALEGLEHYVEPRAKHSVKLRIRSYFMRTPCCNVGPKKTISLSTITLKTPSNVVAHLLEEFTIPCQHTDHTFLHDQIQKWVKYFRWQIEPYVSGDKLRKLILSEKHINQENSGFTQTISYTTGWDRLPDIDLLQVFLTHQAQLAKTPAARDWATRTLHEMTGYGISPHVCRSFLLISSHEADGKAHASATVAGTVKFKLEGEHNVEGEANASADLSGAYKQSFSRFQTFVWADEVPVMTSYDTQIRYSSFAFTGKLNVSGNAESSWLGKKGKGWELVDAEKNYTPTRLNRMRYKSSVVVWTAPASSSGDATLLAGTGLIYGESFVVKNLRNIYQRRDEGNFIGEEDKYIKLIAETLQVPPAVLWQFFQHAEVEEHIRTSLFPMKEQASLLFEATFRANTEALATDQIKFKNETINRQEIPALDSDTLTKLHEMKEKDNENKLFKLESIRMRYRKRDHKENVKKLFNLGFKIGSTKLKIKLDKIEASGADAIVDLVTFFVDEEHRELHDKDPAKAYERAVSPAILFCQ